MRPLASVYVPHQRACGAVSPAAYDGTTADRLSPVLVAGGVSFVAVSAGGSHTCGVTAAGAAYCWGANGSGALGDGTTTQRLTPTRVVQ